MRFPCLFSGFCWPACACACSLLLSECRIAYLVLSDSCPHGELLSKEVGCQGSQRGERGGSPKRQVSKEVGLERGRP